MLVSDIHDDVRDVLAYPFDFALDEIPTDPIWFSTLPDMLLTPIAGDGTGGVYALLPATSEVLFVSSDGGGGIIAPDLASLIRLIVSHPYWQDLLKFSGNGDLSEMRRAVPFLVKGYKRSFPDFSDRIEFICRRLQLRPSDETIHQLHACIATSPQRIRIFAPDGSELGSLFNRFTIDSNPNWRSTEP